MSRVDLSQFHQTFFDESVEGLDAMEAALLKLDTGDADPELVNTIFRSAHSIKGGSATFGFPEIAAFTHVAEELLDNLRSGKRQVSVEIVELLLRCVDGMRGMLDRAQRAEAAANAATNALLDELRAALGTAPTPRVVAAPDAGTNASASEAGAEGDWAIAFQPKAQLLRSGNDPLRMFRELAELGELQVSAALNAVPSFDQMDPEVCYVAWDLRLPGTTRRERIERCSTGRCSMATPACCSTIPAAARATGASPKARSAAGATKCWHWSRRIAPRARGSRWSSSARRWAGG